MTVEKLAQEINKTKRWGARANAIVTEALGIFLCSVRESIISSGKVSIPFIGKIGYHEVTYRGKVKIKYYFLPSNSIRYRVKAARNDYEIIEDRMPEVRD